MSYIYRVKLKPLAPFFFGGEHTFGADEARRESSRYYAKSTLFPQQSALLGMLRKTMLTEAGYMTMHKRGEWVDGKEGDTHSRAKSLCGDGSFSYEHDFDTGTIISLSPLYILHNERSYTLEPKDTHFNPKFSDASMSLGEKHSKVIFFEGFDPKDPKEQQLVSPDSGTDRLSIDKIFTAVESVGIKKSSGGKTEDNAFFMKRSFAFDDETLDDETLFAATLETSEEITWRQSMVTLGADQSPFMLSIEPYEYGYHSLFAPIVTTKAIDRVVALSDMLIDEKAYNEALFVMGERLTVRHIERDADRHYRPKKSRRYYLIGRGSVIYAEDIEALKNALAKTHLQKIGLNHYTTTQGEN